MLETIVQGVLLGGLYTLFALGQSLMFGVMRLTNTAQGDFIILGAFAVIVLMRRQDVVGDELKDFSGLHARHPFAAFAMLLFMLSLGGIPPTAGFMGKFWLFGAAIDAGYVWLAVIGVLNSDNAALTQQVADLTAGEAVTQEQIDALTARLASSDAALDSLAPDAPDAPNVPA